LQRSEFTAIGLETASILKEAMQLGQFLINIRKYLVAEGIKTDRCERVYVKSLTPLLTASNPIAHHEQNVSLPSPILEV
jgi:hypothetical protein